MQTLYKKSRYTENYVCTETGKKCELVTQHFAEFNRFLKKRHKGPFHTCARNLCEENNCSVWKKALQKLQEAKNSVFQKNK